MVTMPACHAVWYGFDSRYLRKFIEICSYLTNRFRWSPSQGGDTGSNPVRSTSYGRVTELVCKTNLLQQISVLASQ